jgi:hypothetical protein
MILYPDQVYVLDNIIPLNYQNRIYDYLVWENLWSANGFIPRTSYQNKEDESSLISPKNNIQDQLFEAFQFQHLVIENKNILSLNAYEFTPILYFIQNHFKFSFSYIIHKIKLNLQTQSSEQSIGKFSPPHVDLVGAPNNMWTIIYYVNDSDGDTVIFNERYNGKPIKNFTVNKKITPKKGKCVMFPTDYVHSGGFPFSSINRTVINFNVEIFN